jgi:hypothetical protein
MLRFAALLPLSVALAAGGGAAGDDLAELRRPFEYDAKKPLDARLTLVRQEGVSDDPDLRALRAAYSAEQMEAYLKLNRPFDAIRYVGKAAPVPLLFQFARHERSFTEGDMNRYYLAASEPKAVLWYSTGHDLNDLRTLADRAAWLGPRISLAPLRPIFEKRLEGLAR